MLFRLLITLYAFFSMQTAFSQSANTSVIDTLHGVSNLAISTNFKGLCFDDLLSYDVYIAIRKVNSEAFNDPYDLQVYIFKKNRIKKRLKRKDIIGFKKLSVKEWETILEKSINSVSVAIFIGTLNGTNKAIYSFEKGKLINSYSNCSA